MAADPIIHPLTADDHPITLVQSLTSRERERSEPGVHVVVHVSDEGNVAYARIVDEGSVGHLAQRWLRHARRGASPGGWTEPPHPRSEAERAAWMAEHAEALDRLLIDSSKRAWRLDGDAPYVVEFAPVPLEADGTATI